MIDWKNMSAHKVIEFSDSCTEDELKILKEELNKSYDLNAQHSRKKYWKNATNELYRLAGKKDNVI
jgi:hypothetical protein